MPVPPSASLSTVSPTHALLSTATYTPTPVPLSGQVGFDDESISLLEKQGFSLRSSKEVTLEGNKIVEFFFRDNFRTVLLIYRVEPSGEFILLLNTFTDKFPELTEIETVWLDEWGDLNQDGLPDVVAYLGQTGTAWGIHNHIHLFQVTEDGELVDLTRPLYEKYGLVPQRSNPKRDLSLADVNGDGLLEFQVNDFRGEWYGGGHAGGALSFKVYSWDGDTVRDVSSDFLELYEDKISRNVEIIQKSYQEPLDDIHKAQYLAARGYGILMDYENTGRSDEGWELYWRLTEPSNWSVITEEAKEYLEQKRMLHLSQYRRGETFAPN